MGAPKHAPSFGSEEQNTSINQHHSIDQPPRSVTIEQSHRNGLLTNGPYHSHRNIQPLSNKHSVAFESALGVNVPSVLSSYNN